MSETTPQVQDMFGDDASNKPVQRRRATVAPPPPSEPEPERSRFHLSRRAIVSIITVVVLVGSITGLAVVQKFRSSSKTNTTNTAATATKNTNTAATNISLTNVPPAFAVDRPKDVTTQDLDHDGLTNLEEVQAGTSPEDADSDHDGLTDYQEVRIYHTNPMQPDSDGDGFSDGKEITTGNNPLGPGKLPR